MGPFANEPSQGSSNWRIPPPDRRPDELSWLGVWGLGAEILAIGIVLFWPDPEQLPGMLLAMLLLALWGGGMALALAAIGDIKGRAERREEPVRGRSLAIAAIVIGLVAALLPIFDPF